MALAPLFAYLVAGVSALKIGLGLLGWSRRFLAGPAEMPAQGFIFLALLLAFSTGGAFLLASRRRDERALTLGVFYLLVATSFSDVLIAYLLGHPWLGALVLPARSVQVESFIPFFAWHFFSGFPRVRSIEPDRFSLWGRTTSLVLGTVLLSLNLLLGFSEVAGRMPWVAAFDRGNRVGPYWFLLFAFALPSFLYAVMRVNRAVPEERRRTNLLVFGFVLGGLPVVLLVLGSVVSPAFHEVISLPPWHTLTRVVVYPALLSIPITTGYAVLARGALDVRLVVRAAIGYVLARRTVTSLTLLPVALLIVVLYVNRDQTLASVISGPSGGALVVAGSVGILGLRFRAAALRYLDRRFFREQYDARVILGGLVHGVREIGNVDQLAGLLVGEIQRALHPRFVMVLTLNFQSRHFETRGREVPPLPESSMIAGTLRGGVSPLDVPVFAEGYRDNLSTMERHWLDDSDAEVMVPLLSREKKLLGLVLLGEKRSELPYSREDRRLLVDIAAAASDTLAQRLLPALQSSLGGERATARLPSNSSRLYASGAARECVRCGQIGPSDLRACPFCGGEMKEAPVPLFLRGVYRLETRIGQGGMGLVYRALDLSLGRPVAVKTLIRIDPDLAARLRREARAMAAVTHSNLATIYGAESWRGRPLIVVEYFGAGTLEDRLAKGPLPLYDGLAMGIALAGGLEHLHQLGMLHRDIKPSNIGLSEARHPKLLDFGLVQFRGGEPAPGLPEMGFRGEAVDSPPVPLAWPRHPAATRTGRFQGTVPYLSPEVLAGGRPGAYADLWSLAVVLFESVAGVNPFMNEGGAARTVLPDLRTFLPTCPPGIAGFFARALSSNPSKRPGSMRELRNELEGLLGLTPVH